MLSHAYTILIYFCVGSPGHGKYVVDGLNANEKSFITMLMTTMKLTGAATNALNMVMHTTISNTDISLAMVLKNYISDPTRTHKLIYHRKKQKKS